MWIYSWKECGRTDLHNLLRFNMTNPKARMNKWCCGECSTFAHALHQRFGAPMYAFLERAKKDNDETLIHAGVVHAGRFWDSRGSHSLAETTQWYTPGGYYPDEPSEIVFEPITRDRLDQLHDVDVDKTKPAHQFIRGHEERFRPLEAAKGTSSL